MKQLVALNNVSKVYGDLKTKALDGITLSIPGGELTAVMGPSGSGKSTLLNLVGGLDRPTAGTIVIDGEDLGRLNEAGLARFRRARVGIIFQFFNLLNNLSALENVLIPARLAGARPDEARRRAGSLMERLEIADLQNQYPARISGGQRQRVAIARALINNPALLLADEPTGALDSRSGDQVMAILADLRASGQTIVLVTHDGRLARAHATREVELIDGRVTHHREYGAPTVAQAQ